MTVRELIKHLQQFPEDLVVIQTMGSDYWEVEEKAITQIEVSFRAGRYCTRYDSMIYPKDEIPEYRQVVYIG